MIFVPNVRKLMELFVKKLTDIMSLITLEKGVSATTSSSRGGGFPNHENRVVQSIAVLKIRGPVFENDSIYSQHYKVNDGDTIEKTANCTSGRDDRCDCLYLMGYW